MSAIQSLGDPLPTGFRRDCRVHAPKLCNCGSFGDSTANSLDEVTEPDYWLKRAAVLALDLSDARVARDVLAEMLHAEQRKTAQLRADLARSVAREKELIQGANRFHKWARGETAELKLGMGRRK